MVNNGAKAPVDDEVVAGVGAMSERPTRSLTMRTGDVLVARDELLEVWGPAYTNETGYLRVYTPNCGASSRPTRPTRATY